MKPHRSIIALVSFCCIGIASAHQPLGIAYYDADHLYDTVASPFYYDDDYTPEGRLKWNTERYNRKIRAVAAVIDSLGMPLVALWGVESEAVVRDIAAACEGAYSYLHRTLNTLDGMDFALLYYGDVFFPEYDEPGRRYLYVEGSVRHGGLRDTLGLVLCSDARTAEWITGALREDHPGRRFMVLGRTALRDPAALGLQDATGRAEAAGRGNVRAREGWRMRDRILADTALKVVRADVFARRYLVDDKDGYPMQTYDRSRYRGGAGYALPVFVYIR